MTENLFDSNTLMKCIDDKSTKLLEDKTIDVSANFLAGKSTTAFRKVMQNDLVQSLTSTAITTGAAWGMGKGIVDSFKEDELKQLHIIGENIVAESLSIITQKSGEIVGKQTDKLSNKLLNSPIDILQYGQSYFMTYKKSMDQVIKELMLSMDKKEVEELENYQTNKIAKFGKEKKRDIGYYVKKTEKILNTGAEYVNLGLSYIENGPEFIATETNKHLNNVLRIANNYIDDKTDIVNKAIESFNKNMGESAGKTLVIKYNNKLLSLAKKKLNKLKKQKEKAKLDAKAKSLKAIQVIKGQTGG